MIDFSHHLNALSGQAAYVVTLRGAEIDALISLMMQKSDPHTTHTAPPIVIAAMS